MGSDLGEPDLWVSSTNTNAEPRDRLKTPFTQFAQPGLISGTHTLTLLSPADGENAHAA
jgi:hypothetical protein